VRFHKSALSVAGLLVGISATAVAGPITFSTGAPDGAVGTGSRPGSGAVLEIESADDFTLGSAASINHATFYGLLPTGATAADINQVRVEIYRIFPLDSVNPPSGNVPTRSNSPSDNALFESDSALADLTFSTSLVSPSFTVANSVLNGIFAKPNQTTLGEGPVTGAEFLFDVAFTTPLLLPAGHYFFVPQVGLSSGDFLWLSAAKVTPPPADLQSWIRNETLAPDWLRIGTDVIGSGSFNAAFSLSGQAVPEPATMAMIGAGLLLVGTLGRKAARRP
jgi:hypothetical protein